MATFALLYSDTGGGHRTAADSIQQAFAKLNGKPHRVEAINAIAYLPRPFNHSEATYRIAINHARWLHHLNYVVLDDVQRMQAVGTLLSKLDGERLNTLFREHPADVYVSCQPQFNPFVPRAMQLWAPRARYAHVVTDLSHIHSFHVTPFADVITTPTEEARRELIARGLLPQRVITTGQPVIPSLEERIQRGARSRATRGLRDDLPVVLLLGGGEGAGLLDKTARAIVQAGLPVQLVVICGRNQALRQALSRDIASPTTQVLGFVDDVPEWMGASDVLITKAGSTTLAEGFVAGLPIIIFDALPGQEEGPRDYAVSHGAAVWCPTPASVVAQLRAWLGNPEALERVRRASKSLARPHAALDIARALMALCD
ncbi:MAG: UDP-N-acetylglucosamine 2-epimerase [Thermoflexales bacterium]|nr:UDP-N-acetylglucosamine 2-epimerase [Thermoflexales bacterium]MDW8351977.1 glycosyltransferase [Anaerolineae bacterium]